MTLRRSDSLPARLREKIVPPPDDNKDGLGNPQTENTIPDSKTVPNFQETPNREEVVAAWKSLQTDVTNIKNGFATKNGPTNHVTIREKSIMRSYVPSKTTAVKDRDGRKKITYANQDVGISARDGDRSSSYPMAPAKETTASVARRRTLFQRLLSWRTECNCREHYRPKPRPEDLLCTCGMSNINRASEKDKRNKFSERGRSKSVGYETAREITQFRRCASAGATVGVENAAALRARAALTLARRYYPEGGWGWTVTVVGTLVQVLTHGLQLGGGTGAIACTAAVKFRVAPLYTYGKYLYFIFNSKFYIW